MITCATAGLEAASPHPAEQGPDQGDQEEPQEVQRSVQRQGQDAAQQGQQGAGKLSFFGFFLPQQFL